MNHPTKLSAAFSGALRTFSYWIAGGSVGLPLLDGIEYREIMLAEPSLMAGFCDPCECHRIRSAGDARQGEIRAASCRAIHPALLRSRVPGGAAIRALGGRTPSPAAARRSEAVARAEAAGVRPIDFLGLGRLYGLVACFPRDRLVAPSSDKFSVIQNRRMG